MSWFAKIADKIPEILHGLVAEAKKYSTFEEFEKAFLVELKHGLYWHITDNPNFAIDPEKGPHDMSSLSTGHSMSKGKLMITSHLTYWASSYFPQRKYAALIDMSEVSSKLYYQVNRGMGNEFFVTNPSKAKVIKVFHLKDALRIDDMHHKIAPQSKEELKQLYEKAQMETVLMPDEVVFEPSKEDQRYYDQTWEDE